MTDEKRDIEQYFADTIMGRPYGFSVGERHFALYPVTLGKMFLLQRQTAMLGIVEENIQRDVSLEALRLAKEKRRECLTIICYHTCSSPDEIFDNALVTDRIGMFDRELSEEDIAALMIIVLTADKTNMFMSHYGIEKEQERMGIVMRTKSKDDKNNLVFGGKTIYGTTIDAACERYGWTKEYVVWGIDYASLKLMLSDKVNSVYCTDEELKKIPAPVKSKDQSVIKAEKGNMNKILNMDWR